MMRSFIFLSLISLLSHDLSAGFNGPVNPVTEQGSLSSVSRGAPNPQPPAPASTQDWEALFAATIGRTQQASHDMEIEPAPASESQVAPLPEKTFQHEAEFLNEAARRAGEPIKDYSYASSSTDQFAGLEFDGILGCPVPLPDLKKMPVRDLKKYRREFLLPVGNIGRKLMQVGRIKAELTENILSELKTFYGERVQAIINQPEEIHAFVLSLRKWELYISQFQVEGAIVFERGMQPPWRLAKYKSLFTSQGLSFSDRLKFMNATKPDVLDEALQKLRSPKKLRAMTDAMQGLSLQGQGGKRSAPEQGSGSTGKRGPGKKRLNRL